MKKHFFYFLLTAFVFNFLFLNNFALAQAEGVSGDPGNSGNSGNFIIDLGWLPDKLFEAVERGARAAVVFLIDLILGVLLLIVNIIAFVLWAILMIPLKVFSFLIDFVSNLNPFEGDNAPGIALWNALKNWGYIILTFVGLYAGFQWLFGEDSKAKKLIFNILLVALLINFTFLFVKEAFNIVWKIEKGISGGEVGGIFRNTALKTSPWSLAYAIQTGGLPPRINFKLEDPGNVINHLADDLLEYATRTIVTIINGDKIYNQLMTAMSASLISIVFTFIILLITFIAFVLYVARYFLITFLAAISSIAIASIAFPEIRIGNKSFSLNLFDQWFSYFVRWILVIPVFLILFLASYNIFSQFIGTGTDVGRVGHIPALAQLVFGLVLIIGSFLLSIIFAEELTGAAASLAKGFVLGASAYLGGLAVGKALKMSGNKAADILEKTGGKIAESRLPMALRARGVQLQKEAQNLRKNIYERSLANRQAVVSYNLERLRQTKPGREKKEALQDLVKIIEGEKNPWIRTELIRGLNLSDKDFTEILTDNNYADEARKILSLMGGSEAPREAREKLAKIFKGMPARKFLLVIMKQTLYEIWDNLHAEIQKNFLEAIEDLKTEDLIKEFTKLKKNDWQNLYNLSQSYPNTYQLISESYNKASSNAFMGFIEAVVNNNINTLRANIPFYPEIFGHLDKITGLIGPNNAARLLIEGLRTAPPETTKYFYPIWFSMRSQLQQLQQLQKQQQLQPQQLEQLQQLSYLLSRSQQIIKVFANDLRQKGDWNNIPRQTQIQINALESARKP